MYNDAEVNILKKTLPLQMDHTKKKIKRERRNPKCKTYENEYLAKLVQAFSKICVFCKVRGLMGS
jgi:hypothetical protein